MDGGTPVASFADRFDARQELARLENLAVVEADSWRFPRKDKDDDENENEENENEAELAEVA